MLSGARVGVKNNGGAWSIALCPDCPHYCTLSNLLQNGGAVPLQFAASSIVSIPVTHKYSYLPYNGRGCAGITTADHGAIGRGCAGITTADHGANGRGCAGITTADHGANGRGYIEITTADRGANSRCYIAITAADRGANSRGCVERITADRGANLRGFVVPFTSHGGEEVGDGIVFSEDDTTVRRVPVPYPNHLGSRDGCIFAGQREIASVCSAFLEREVYMYGLCLCGWL
jgi:hypothetical protein